MCVRKNRTTNFDIVISDEGSMGRSFVFIQEMSECMTEEELNIEYIQILVILYGPTWIR